MAASGAYYISCAADKIYANRNALIGSIGVICGASMDFTDFMNNLGIKSKTFHSGKNKTMMNYNEPLTEEQITIMQSICDNAYEQFTGIVAAGRNLSMEQTTKLSDGRIYTAKQGLENGLVDAVDSWENMIRNMKDTEFEGKDLSVTEFNYEREPSLSDFIMGKFGLSQTAALLICFKKIIKGCCRIFFANATNSKLCSKLCTTFRMIYFSAVQPELCETSVIQIIF